MVSREDRQKEDVWSWPETRDASSATSGLEQPMSIEDRMLEELLESIERKSEKAHDGNKLKRKGTGRQKGGDGVGSLMATAFRKMTPRKHYHGDVEDDVDNEKQCSSSDTINQADDTSSHGHNSCMSSTSSTSSTKSISTSTSTPPRQTSSILPSEKSTIVTRMDCLEDRYTDWSLEKEDDGLNICYPARTTGSLQERFVRLEELFQSIPAREVDMDGTMNKIHGRDHEEKEHWPEQGRTDEHEVGSDGPSPSAELQVHAQGENLQILPSFVPSMAGADKKNATKALKVIDRNQRGSDGREQETKTPANLSEGTNTTELAEECIKQKQRIGDEEEAPVPGNGRSGWLVVVIAVLLSLYGLRVAPWRCFHDNIEYGVKSRSTSSSVLVDEYGNVQIDQVWPALSSRKGKKKGAGLVSWLWSHRDMKSMRLDGSGSRVASQYEGKEQLNDSWLPLSSRQFDVIQQLTPESLLQHDESSKSKIGVSPSPSSSPLQPGKWLCRFWKLLRKRFSRFGAKNPPRFWSKRFWSSLFRRSQSKG